MENKGYWKVPKEWVMEWGLTPTEAVILSDILTWFGKGCKGCTLRERAERMNMSAEGVRQVLNKIHQKVEIDTEENSVRKIDKSVRKVDKVATQDSTKKVDKFVRIIDKPVRKVDKTVRKVDKLVRKVDSPIYNDIEEQLKNNEEQLKNNEEQEYIEPEKTKKTVFRIPTVEEVKEYCSERGNNIDPEAFVNFYESKGWCIGKQKMKDWRAAVRTWERRNGGVTLMTMDIAEAWCEHYKATFGYDYEASGSIPLPSMFYRVQQQITALMRSPENHQHDVRLFCLDMFNYIFPHLDIYQAKQWSPRFFSENIQKLIIQMKNYGRNPKNGKQGITDDYIRRKMLEAAGIDE